MILCFGKLDITNTYQTFKHEIFNHCSPKAMKVFQKILKLLILLQNSRVVEFCVDTIIFFFLFFFIIFNLKKILVRKPWEKRSFENLYFGLVVDSTFRLCFLTWWFTIFGIMPFPKTVNKVNNPSAKTTHRE